jgi:hypothetical protein
VQRRAEMLDWVRLCLTRGSNFEARRIPAIVLFLQLRRAGTTNDHTMDDWMRYKRLERMIRLWRDLEVEEEEEDADEIDGARTKSIQ